MAIKIKGSRYPQNFFLQVYGVDEIDESMSLHKTLSDVFNTLITRHVFILMLRFRKLMTYKEISEIMGVTVPRIEQLLKINYRKLQHPSRKFKLRPYFIKKD